MAYNVLSGEIVNGYTYKVIGTKSVVYNGVTITTGNTFKGIAGVNTFTYSGSGTEELNEVLTLEGASVEYTQTGIDFPTFADMYALNGFSVEYSQVGADVEVLDITMIGGFNVEYNLINQKISRALKNNL